MTNNTVLNHKVYGEGSAFIMLHGLLGSGDNWLSFGKRFIDKGYQLILPDARNHGKSFHSDEMNYALMAKDLRALLDHLDLDKITLLGHSMGGKTAMKFAELFAERLHQLIIIDSSMEAFPGNHRPIMEAIAQTDVTEMKSRKDIDRTLSEKLQEPGLRYFIMKNINRSESGYSWKLNIDGIMENYPNLIAGLDIERPVAVETLFCRGQKSDYIRLSEIDKYKNIFANMKMITINGAGHWVHADEPDKLFEAVSAFIG